MIAAAELAGAENPAEAVERLNALASNTEVPQIYRDLASFKALLVPGGSDVATRRNGFTLFEQPGHPLRLLASEQLALLDIETGETKAAIERMQSILTDAEATRALQERALQVIVALGAEPDLSALLGLPQDG
jgi:hypothetical protein